MKLSGEDYQTILLSPPIPSSGRSFVEFEIISQAHTLVFKVLSIMSFSGECIGVNVLCH
jgi:hypothetical protein